ncbi:MAG: SdrD B-like domain-containing protein, partial [Bacteroidota bacterium]
MKQFILFVTLLLALFVQSSFASNVTKTVGISGGYDYPTLRVALDDINTNGIADSVSLMLMDTTYTDFELKLNPQTSQPGYFAMFQGGSKKPEINISQLPPGFVSDSIAFKAEGVRDITIYNCIWFPNPAEIWKAAVRVDDCEQNGNVYIQSGGVTGATAERGYDVHADNSGIVNVFGCLIINVQTTAINIEYSACAGPKSATAGVAMIEGNTVYGSATTTGISVSGGTNITEQDNNVLYCDVGTVITNTEEGGEIHILGGVDSVYTSSVHIPNAHNLASITIGSSNTLSGKKARRASASMLKLLGKNGTPRFSSTPAENAIDISIDNDAFAKTQITIYDNDIYWAGGDGISVVGNPNKDVGMYGNLIDLDGTGSAIRTIAGGWHVDSFFDITYRIDGNTISNTPKGIDIEFDNENTGGIPLDSIKFPKIQSIGNTITLVPSFTGPSPSAMQLKSKRSELPTNVDAIRTANNTVDYESGGFLSEPTFFSLPESLLSVHSFTFDNNNISGMSLGRLALQDYVHDELWTGAPLSISNNHFTDGDGTFDIADYTDVKFDNNLFTSGECTDCNPGIPKENKAGNRYELQVRGSNRVRKTGTTIDVMNVSVSGNNYCGVEAITTVEGGNLTFENNTITGGAIVAGKAANKYEVNYRRGSKVGKTTASDDTLTANVKNNHFCSVDVLIASEDVDMNFENNTATSGTAFAKATNKYELQFRRSSRFNKSESDSMFYASMKDNSFDGYDVTVNDTDVALVMTGNTFNNATPVFNKAGNKYEVSVRRGQRFSKTAFSEIQLVLEMADNDFSGGDVVFNVDDFVSTIENNTFNASSATNKAANKYEVNFRRGSKIGKTSSSVATVEDMFTYNNNSVIGYDVAISIDDSSDVASSVTMDGNSFDGIAPVSSKFPAGNKYEIAVRKSKNYQKTTSVGQEDFLTYTKNTHTNFGEGGLIGLEDVCATLDSNTFDGESANKMPAGNKYEVVARKSKNYQKTSSATEYCLAISNNSFTNLSDGGLLATLTNEADDTMNVGFGANTFSNNEGNGLEISIDSGSVTSTILKNIFADNTGNGILLRNEPRIDVWVNRFRAITEEDKFNNNGTNEFINNGGDGIHLEGNIVVEGLNYQNFSGNTGYNLYNGTPNDIDATNNWWGTTNAVTIAEKIYDRTDSVSFGTVDFTPFRAEEISSLTGTISGTVYNDADGDGTKDESESGLNGWSVILSSGGIAADTATTSESGEYSFNALELAEYSLAVVLQTNYVGTQNSDGAEVSFSTNNATVNFGVFADTYTFRTFKADVALTAKPVKLKYKSGALLEQPNTATVMENF